MKILHVSRQFYPLVGGLENYVLALAGEQVKMGHEVGVITLNRSFIDGKKLPPEDTAGNIHIKRLPFFGTTKYPLAPGVYKYLKNYDLIHVHAVDFFADFIALTKILHGKKFVLHTHGGFFHTKWGRNLKKIFFHTVTRTSLLAAHKVIASSENDYQTFSRVTRKVVKIDNGVQVSKFTHVTKDNKKNDTLLYLGRIDIHKGLEKLLNLVSHLNKTGKQVNLRIAGPDWKNLVPSLKQKAKKAGIEHHVTFLGMVDDETMIKEMGEATVFVSASSYEGFGISVVEAMASGTPCVLNDIPSFRKIAGDRDFAKIVDFSNAREAAKAVLSFLDMDPHAYSEAGKKARSESLRYSWQTVARKIMTEIEIT